MRKDSINTEAVEKAYLIYKEHGHKIVNYDFSHAQPTDYARGTVMEPEHTSIVEGAFNELTPANLSNGFRYEDLKDQAEELNSQIDAQQDKLRMCRQRWNFQEFQRCMQEMKDMIKQKEQLDAQMAVATPGGNAGQKQMDDYNRTYDQDDSYSEMSTLGDRIEALEKMIIQYSEKLRS
jgi:phage shock protein A